MLIELVGLLLLIIASVVLVLLVIIGWMALMVGLLARLYDKNIFDDEVDNDE